MSVNANGLTRPHPLSSNPLQTRTDFREACKSILAPLLPHFTPGCTRVKIGATATHYDEGAAQIEGFARACWGLGALIADDGEQGKESEELIEKFRTGLINGTNPEHPEYWGDVEDRDQRMVEICPLGFLLVVAKDRIWDKLDEKQKEDLGRWIGNCNVKEMPDTNW